MVYWHQLLFCFWNSHSFSHLGIPGSIRKFYKQHPRYSWELYICSYFDHSKRFILFIHLGSFKKKHKDLKHQFGHYAFLFNHFRVHLGSLSQLIRGKKHERPPDFFCCQLFLLVQKSHQRCKNQQPNKRFTKGDRRINWRSSTGTKIYRLAIGTTPFIRFLFKRQFPGSSGICFVFWSQQEYPHDSPRILQGFWDRQLR